MRLSKIVLPGVPLALLSACSYFDDTDPREGAEDLEACAKRLAGAALDDALFPPGTMITPTFTYDITKVALEDLQELAVPGSDETAGARGMAATNETSTAVDNFMVDPVDEKGAFFMGRDPALYRVRGEAVAVEDAVAAGCARQSPGMRLISFTAAPAEATSDAGQDNQNINENDS